MKTQRTLKYSEAMGMASQHIRMPAKAKKASDLCGAINEPVGQKSRITLCKMIGTLRNELERVKGKK